MYDFIFEKRLIKSLFVIIVFVFLSFTSIETMAYGWGFSRNSRNEIPNIGIYEKEIENTNSYYVDKSGSKNIYLTFDAGYDNGILPQILDVLKDKNVKSTFFVTGDFITREKELLLRIDKEGHIVANHTWNHKNITKISTDELKREISRVEEAYYSLTGKNMVKFFRPPEGEFDTASLMKVKELGYKTFFWSIAYRDWDTKNQSGNMYGYNKIMDNLHDGAIILLHTVSKDNLECLPSVIDDIRELGYTIKNLDEMPL